LSSSDALKGYVTRILFVVAIVVVVYGVVYFVDQFSSHLYKYLNISFMWLFFRLFLAVSIIYIGIMLFKIGRAVSRGDMGSLANILFLKKKWSLPIVFLVMSSVSGLIIVPVCISSSLAGYYNIDGCFPHFAGQPVYIERFAGYFAHRRGRNYVQIIDAIDLQMVFSRAQANGFEATYDGAAETLSVSEEYYDITRMRGYRDYLRILCNQGTNDTAFDHAVPTFVIVDCQETSAVWFESKLRGFFPGLLDEEYHGFAESLASGYNTIKIAGSPDWAAIRNYLGAFDHISCVPIGGFSEYYSNGQINYWVSSVTIRRIIISNIDDSVTFAISANSRGFVGIIVRSEFLLYEEWIREILTMMFFDVGLPAEGIWMFEFEENWLIDWRDQ